MRQASQNPWLNAMEGVGRVGIGIGSSMLGSAVGPLGQQLGDVASQGLIQYGKKGTTFGDGGTVGTKEEAGLDILHSLAKLGKKSSLKKIPLLGSMISVGSKIVNNENLTEKDYLSLIPTGITQAISFGGDLIDEYTNGEYTKQNKIYNKNKESFNKMSSKQKEEFLKKRSLFAFGGNTSNVPVEVEDDEVAETPQGELLEFNGKKHEEGGIDVNLPAGTDIYSDRIAIDGKTMSERKKDRKKRLAKMSKLLESKKGDYLLKNSFKRTSELNDLEEEQDKKIQEYIRAIKEGKPLQENEEAAYGGKLIAGYGFNGIGPATWLDSEVDMYKNDWNKDSNVFIPNIVPFNSEDDRFKNASNQIKLATEDRPLTTDNTVLVNPLDKIDLPNYKVNPALDYNPEKQLNDIKNNKSSIATEDSEESFGNSILKNGIGDSLGLAGELIQGFGPLWNTMNNRAGDTPNINFHKNYGLNALKTNDDNLALIDQEADLNKVDLQLTRNAQVKRMRNSARSVNTLRTLDLASDQQLNRSLNDVYSNKVKAISANNNVKAQLQNQRDEVTMNAEDKRDERDRMDRDDYYTQHASDLNQLGMHIAGIGKNFNTARDNSEAVDLVNTLSKYGLTIEDLRKAKSKVKKKK